MKLVENFQDGTPGPGGDEDRTREISYTPAGRVATMTARASGVSQVTRYVWGVRLSDPHSQVSSNDRLGRVEYPDPQTGQPSTSPEDQERYGYDATGRLIWSTRSAAPQEALSPVFRA